MSTFTHFETLLLYNRFYSKTWKKNSNPCYGFSVYIVAFLENCRLRKQNTFIIGGSIGFM